MNTINSFVTCVFAVLSLNACGATVFQADTTAQQQERMIAAEQHRRSTPVPKAEEKTVEAALPVSAYAGPSQEDLLAAKRGDWRYFDAKQPAAASPPVQRPVESATVTAKIASPVSAAPKASATAKPEPASCQTLPQGQAMVRGTGEKLVIVFQKDATSLPEKLVLIPDSDVISILNVEKDKVIEQQRRIKQLCEADWNIATSQFPFNKLVTSDPRFMTPAEYAQKVEKASAKQEEAVRKGCQSGCPKQGW